MLPMIQIGTLRTEVNTLKEMKQFLLWLLQIEDSLH
jgi:hypothetical protein